MSKESSHGLRNLGVLFLLACAAAAILPQITPYETMRRVNDDRQIAWVASNVAVAETAIKRVLKDPDSAQFRDVGVITPEVLDTNKAGVVCGDVNSKNSFGAYVGYKPFLVISGIPMLKDRSRTFVRLYNRECAGKSILYP